MNNQTVVPNELSVWLYRIINSTRLSTFRYNEGQYLKSKIPFMPKEKSISSQNYRWMFGISDRSVRRIMRDDLRLRLYKIVIEALLSDDQTKKIGKLSSDKFSKRRHPMRIPFSYEKSFGIPSRFSLTKSPMSPLKDGNSLVRIPWESPLFSQGVPREFPRGFFRGREREKERETGSLRSPSTGDSLENLYFVEPSA